MKNAEKKKKQKEAKALGDKVITVVAVFMDDLHYHVFKF